MTDCKDCGQDIYRVKGWAQGYCKSCYDRHIRNGTITTREIAPKGFYDGKYCEVEGCEEPVKYKGFCKKHYKRQWRHGNPNVTMNNMSGGVCQVEGCDRPRKSANGYCAMHWTRVYRHNREHRIKGEAGSGVINAGGYRMLTINKTRIYEHTLVVERALGRPLPPNAVVHHMNSEPADNKTPFNLIVCPSQDYHLLLHRRMKVYESAVAFGLSKEERTKALARVV